MKFLLICLLISKSRCSLYSLIGVRSLEDVQDIHRSKFVNWYFRAVDIVIFESSRGIDITWKNFCFGVSNYDLFANLRYSETNIDE